MLATIIYGFIIFTVVLVIIFIVEVNAKNANEEVGIYSDAIGLIHMKGIPFLDEGEMSFLEGKGDRLFINQTYFIMYDRVKSVRCLSGLEVEAVIDHENDYFLLLDYVGKEDEDLTGVFHVGDTVDMKVKSFMSDVNEKIGL